MGYDGSYMMGGMHGLWWLFWLVLLGFFCSAVGGAPRTGRIAPPKRCAIRRTSCCIGAWPAARSLPPSMKNESRC